MSRENSQISVLISNGDTPRLPRRGIRAFSLVEVVMALGILTFAGLALVGLFSVGLNVNRESAQELQATHIMQTLFTLRRAAPEATDIAGSPLALPPLDVAESVGKSNPVLLDKEGKVASDLFNADYGLIYRIEPSASGKSSKVYVGLFWPGKAGADNAQGVVEMTTTIPLR